MNLAELAKSLGQSENDVAGFLAGLSVWVKKGYSIEVAISKHMEVMTHLANNACKVSRVLSKDTTFVNSVHAAALQ
jgi:hypothetical protein